ncbi:MAG: alpha/beta hydrolase [Gammaproteobacteria bacterium]|nr:alpha/beta hydrolase [Gammaproteobacteria bacterium]
MNDRLAILAAALLVTAPARPATDVVAGMAQFDRAYHRVTLPNGLHMAYVELGDPAGRPVLLVHGYTNTALDWVPLVPYLAPRERLIIPDLRGHGRTDKPECCYRRQDFAYDLRLLLDHLHVARADVIASSMGSIIMQSFVELWPQRIRRVVLIGSTGGHPPGAKPAGAGELSDYAATIRALKEPLDPDSKFMLAWWSSPTPVDPAFNRRQRHDAAAIPLAVWLAMLDQTFPDYEEFQRTLRHFTAPVLLIWGGKDPLMGEDVRASLRSALPQAQVKIFADLGHAPFWEQPEAVAQVINDFLR